MLRPRRISASPMACRRPLRGRIVWIWFWTAWEVGRISTYELLLQNKKIEISFDESEWRQYRASVRNAILVLRVMRKSSNSRNRTGLSSTTPYIRPTASYADRPDLAGIPQYFLHAGDIFSNRLQRLIIARGEAFAYYGYLRDKWLEVQNQPIPLEAMRSGTDHFLEVARAAACGLILPPRTRTPTLDSASASGRDEKSFVRS